jgi:hypothetical protein
MITFVIIEIDDGLSSVEVEPSQLPEVEAALEDGTLVESGPFASYEEACDALAEMEGDYAK